MTKKKKFKHLNLIFKNYQKARKNTHFLKINNIQKAIPKQQLCKMLSLYNIHVFVYCAEIKTKTKIPVLSDNDGMESHICPQW